MGVDDLPELKMEHKLFANKFFFEKEYIGLYCMNDWIANNKSTLNVNYYKNLPIVKHKYIGSNKVK